MITIKYEEYTNDYIRKYKDHTVPFLQSFEDWFFNLCDGDYSKKISIPDPKHSVCKDGPYRMEVNCVWTQNKCYWVHQIMRDGKNHLQRRQVYQRPEVLERRYETALF